MSMLKTRRKKTDRQKVEARLDSLYSDYIGMRAMSRVGGCELCHTPKLNYKALQAAHFHSRGKHTIRWDPRNGTGLCGGCHQYIDSNKEAKLEFELQILGQEEYERLLVLAGMTTKQLPIDYKLIELNEEGEEDRKASTLELLQAQLQKAKEYYEPLIQQAKEEVARAIASFLKKQGAVWVDKNYFIIKDIEEGKHLKG